MNGNVAVITGAGSGIGKAVAMRLASLGCSVVCGDVNLAAAQETADAIGGKGQQAVAAAVDVSSAASVQAFVERALQTYGSIQFLVNAAGIWQRKTIEEISEEEWNRIIDVNLKGTFLVIKAVVPHLKQNRFGRIVNFASVAGRSGGVWTGPHYAASKGGVIAMTKNLARELGPFGINVNAVAPGIIKTPMTETYPAEVMTATIQRTPLGRLGEPEDVADAVLFLLTDEARFITGETLEVNGGLLMD